MKTPVPTAADHEKSRRLSAVVQSHMQATGAKSTKELLNRLDFYSSLQNPNLSYVEARVLCAQAAAKIRELI